MLPKTLTGDFGSDIDQKKKKKAPISQVSLDSDCSAPLTLWGLSCINTYEPGL